MILTLDIQVSRGEETVNGTVEVEATVDSFGSFDAEVVDCEGVTSEEARTWARENACFIHDCACDVRDNERLELEIER